MNVPPKEFIRVMPDLLRSFTSTAFQEAGTSTTDADCLAELLVVTDLRGVFSHGTQQLAGYIEMILSGKVNPRPQVECIDQSQTTAVFDGDGGMGHLPAYLAAKMAVNMAKDMGIGAVTTRNHFHFGGAGKYSRMALKEDCIGFAVSAHRFVPDAGASILSASGGSPMSFAIPTGDQPPIVVDMATSIHGSNDLFQMIPGAFFKSIGLGAVSHALGGFMAGIWLFDQQANADAWEGSNQGAFICAFDIARFRAIDEYKKEIDRHLRGIHQMEPAPGYDRATLPGALEWEREQEWAEIGVPVGKGHQEVFKRVAKLFDMKLPF